MAAVSTGLTLLCRYMCKLRWFNPYIVKYTQPHGAEWICNSKLFRGGTSKATTELTSLLCYCIHMSTRFELGTSLHFKASIKTFKACRRHHRGRLLASPDLLVGGWGHGDVGRSKAPRSPRVTHQLLGLLQGVLHVGEAEAGHRDELAHHRHKLVVGVLGTSPLVLQLLGNTEG